MYIEAWELDKRYHDPLGAATTNNDGSFQISFEDADFRDEASDSRPQIFFRIYHEHRLIKSTENDPISISENTENPSSPDRFKPERPKCRHFSGERSRGATGREGHSGVGALWFQ